MRSLRGLQSCPVQALGEESVIQKLCRNNAYGKTARGFDTVACNKCRSVCPMRFGESDEWRGIKSKSGDAVNMSTKTKITKELKLKTK